MTNVDTRHIPVLLDEVLEYLAPENDCGDCLLLDCTLGGGGHSEALLEQCASMYLVGMDRYAGFRSASHLSPTAFVSFTGTSQILKSISSSYHQMQLRFLKPVVVDSTAF